MAQRWCKVHCFVVQIKSKMATDGWKLGADGAIGFNRNYVKTTPQAAVTEFRFEQLAPILAIGA